MDTDELVTVYTTNDQTLASILANALKDEGIKAAVDSGNQAGFTGIMDIHVQVKESDADRAWKILHRHPQAVKTHIPKNIGDHRPIDRR